MKGSGNEDAYVPIQKITLHNSIYTFVFISVIELFCGFGRVKLYVKCRD